jgi:hypothetical protein
MAVVTLTILWKPRAFRQGVLSLLDPRIDPSSGVGALTGDELATLSAFGEIVVEGHILSEAERGALGRYLADHARDVAGYLALYRSAAAYLDGLARGPFAALPEGERLRLIGERIMTGDGDGAWRLVFRRRAVAIERILVPDLIRGYYESAAGWAVVGYSTFPGQCGDLAGYTRAEA